MDIIFQVLTTVNNHLINIFREDKSTQKKKKKMSACFWNPRLVSGFIIW